MIYLIIGILAVILVIGLIGLIGMMTVAIAVTFLALAAMHVVAFMAGLLLANQAFPDNQAAPVIGGIFGLTFLWMGFFFWSKSQERLEAKEAEKVRREQEERLALEQEKKAEALRLREAALAQTHPTARRVRKWLGI